MPTRSPALLLLAAALLFGCGPSRPPRPPPAKPKIVATPHGIVLPPGALARLGVPALGTATALARSADQRVLAVGSSDGLLRLYWLRRDGARRLLRVEVGPTFFDHGSVTDIALSDDGRLVASAGAPGEEIVVRDVARGTLRQRLFFDSGRVDGESGVPIKEPVTAMRFSPDGALLAAAGKARDVMVWSLKDGQPRDPITVRDKTALEKRCARPIDEQGRIVDRRKLGCVRASPAVHALWFSPDSKAIYAQVGADVGKHALADGKRLSRSRCAANDSCPDRPRHSTRERLAKGDGGRLVHVISLADARAPHSTIVLWPQSWAKARARYSSPVTRLSFSPDSSLLQSLTARGEVRLWHVAKAKLHHDLGKLRRAASRLPYRAPRTLFVDGESKRPAEVMWTAWRAAKAMLEAREKQNPCLGADCQRPYARAVQRVAIWPPSGAIASADARGLYASTLKAPVSRELGAVLGFFDKASLIAAADRKHGVLLCSSTRGSCERPIYGLPREVQRVALSGRSGRVAASSSGGYLLLAKRGAPEKPTLYHPGAEITALAVAGDGRRVAVALSDGTILLYR
ncbi:MAG: hypothetical protein KC503_34125 [Myxococcales bacterium]|nr:hypothetical protein [Myxococcales bacterium]